MYWNASFIWNFRCVVLLNTSYIKHVLYLALVLNYVSHLALLICCIVKKLLYLTLVLNLVCCALCPIVLVTFVACLFSTSALWHLCCLIRLLFGTSVICHLCYLAAVTTNPTEKSSNFRWSSRKILLHVQLLVDNSWSVWEFFSFRFFCLQIASIFNLAKFKVFAVFSCTPP